LLNIWHEQNIVFESCLFHQVGCLADNIVNYKFEQIWTLDGPNATPLSLMSEAFTYEGIKKAIKDKVDRKIFEKGYAEGRSSALQELHFLKAKPATEKPEARLREDAPAFNNKP